MRSWTLSAVLLTAATAFGQQPLPPKADPKPPAAGSLDEAVLHALRQHPDIKLAEAKVRLAEAEAEQAKSQVALRVAAAFAKLEQAKAELIPAQQFVDRIKGLVDAGRGATTELLAAQAQFQKAKSAVVAAEVELNAAKGIAPRVGGGDAAELNRVALEAGLKWLARKQEADGRTEFWAVKPVPAGTVADKLRAALAKPLRLDLKDADLDEAMAAVFKASGDLTISLKLPQLGKKFVKEPPVVTLQGEMSFSAAVQFILDQINSSEKWRRVPEGLWGKYDVYVREYGLLIARVEDAPKDAPTLTEFARQIRAEMPVKK